MSISVVPLRYWRFSAAKIAEELFPVISREDWDEVLDLRQALLNESDWKVVLEKFSRCRSLLETDHYLPFYRLRNLLSSHLRLEGLDGNSLKIVLRKNHSLGELRCSNFRLVEV